MNEALRRALLKAQLTEDDVAARLAVDPKTVRRWTEGRLPYLRHRWELARMLGCDEGDLWPRTASARSAPQEIQMIYPHRGAVPAQAWRSLFESATHKIGILADATWFLAEQPEVIEILASKAQDGVSSRICLLDDSGSLPQQPPLSPPLARLSGLRRTFSVELRAHLSGLGMLICVADHRLAVGQSAYGIPRYRPPVIFLEDVGGGAISKAYVEAFRQTWLNGHAVE